MSADIQKENAKRLALIGIIKNYHPTYHQMCNNQIIKQGGKYIMESDVWIWNSRELFKLSYGVLLEIIKTLAPYEVYKVAFDIYNLYL